jgi:shikimate dehydrogenase
MQNAAFKALGIKAEYRLFEVKPEDLEVFLLEDLLNKDISGINITIPHKIKAREILEKEFPLSFGKLALEDQHYVKLSGAVNTVNREIGQPLYYNTDARGFLKSLEDKDEEWGLNFTTNGKTALVMGSGGAGRAIIAALSWKGVGIKKIYIYDKSDIAVELAQKHFFESSPHAEFLKEKLEFIKAEKIPEILRVCELLVNASSLGMKEGDASVIDKRLLRKDLSVYDVVYNRKTQLITDAQSLDCPAVGGLGMLLYQGVDAFELWTGDKKAPVEIMREALRKAAR